MSIASLKKSALGSAFGAHTMAAGKLLRENPSTKLIPGMTVHMCHGSRVDLAFASTSLFFLFHPCPGELRLTFSQDSNTSRVCECKNKNTENQTCRQPQCTHECDWSAWRARRNASYIRNCSVDAAVEERHIYCLYLLEPLSADRVVSCKAIHAVKYTNVIRGHRNCGSLEEMLHNVFGNLNNYFIECSVCSFFFNNMRSGAGIVVHWGAHPHCGAPT